MPKHTIYIFVLFSLLAFVLQVCRPEGDDRFPVSARPPDPCWSSDADLSDGIGTGDELMAVFECANRNGEFDAFVPLMETMNVELTSDGSMTLLDLWVEILNQKIAMARGDNATLEVQDIIDGLDGVLELLDEPWLPGAGMLLGDFLASGAAEPALEVLGNVADALITLKVTDQWEYEAYFSSLGDLLCPNLEEAGQCVGDAQQLYLGLKSMRAEDSGITSNDGSPADSLNGEALASTLVKYFRPGSDDAESLSLTSALGMGIATLGTPPLLVDGLGRHYPAMYGDHPDTVDVEPGYETYNADLSAIYGLLSMFSTDEGYEEFQHYADADVQIMTHCYRWDYQSSERYEIDRFEEDCETGEGSFAQDNPATFGFEQLLRLVKSVDVDLDEESQAGQFVLDIFNYYAGMEFELSGTQNLATMFLELFAQFPEETVIQMVEASAANPDGIDFFNKMCGTHVQMDDMQALGASVEDEDVHGGVGLFLDVIKVINHAAQPGGIGGMGTFKDLLVDWYDTRMWDDFYPYYLAVLAKRPGAEPEDNSDSLAVIRDFAPGGRYHNAVTLPFLKLALDMRGEAAERWIPPLASGLTRSGPALGELFYGLGTMGENALEAYAANPAATTGLDYVNEVMDGLSEQDPEGKQLEALARALSDPLLLDGLIETLASSQVRQSLETETTPGKGTLIDWMAGVLQDGTLEQLLSLVQGTLSQSR